MNTSPDNDARRENRLDGLLAEYLRRRDAGEEVDVKQLAADNPDVADEIQKLLRMAELVEQMAGPTETYDPLAETIGQERTAVSPWPVEHAVAGSETFEARRFGDYLLLDVLGRGGMGVVYKARQIAMDRLVAVKMIRDGRLASAEELQRFYTEAQAAGRLGHPGIVTVHEAGVVDGHHFFSMDYVEGTTLAKLVEGGSIDQQRAARYLISVAEAVQHAHDSGILHRDLKPANVLIDAQDRPHVTDFGLAKLMEDDSDLTSTGIALGTPGYMSPEQAAGTWEDVSQATDVYSLGAILYALLTGRPPFRGRNIPETILKVIHDDPLPPRALNRQLSRDLETICLKCLHKDPHKRYASARELAADLDRCLRGDPIAAKPAGPWRRAVSWLRRVPLIAALTGNRVEAPSRWHLRVNLAIMLAPLLLLALLGGWWLYGEMVLPARIRIASAKPRGMYHEFALAFAPVLAGNAQRPVHVRPTSGSVQNFHLLLDDEVEVALLQTNASAPGDVAVVTPLYDDVVHVVVRRDKSLTDMQSLATFLKQNPGRVSVGEPGSGMQVSAHKLLALYGLTPRELAAGAVYFDRLETDPRLVAAIVTTGLDNSDLKRILAGGEYDLLPILDAEPLVGPIFHVRTIGPGIYKQPTAESPVAVPAAPTLTLATTTFLAVPEQASDLLVTTLLESLYVDDELVQRFDLFTREQAGDWSMFDLHPAARDYFARPAH